LTAEEAGRLFLEGATIGENQQRLIDESYDEAPDNIIRAADALLSNGTELEELNHNIYQSMEKRDALHKAVQGGEMTPEEARKLRAKVVLQDATSVGLAALRLSEQEHSHYIFRPRRGSISPDTDEGIDVRIHGTHPPKEDAGYGSDSELDIRIHRNALVKGQDAYDNTVSQLGFRLRKNAIVKRQKAYNDILSQQYREIRTRRRNHRSQREVSLNSIDSDSPPRSMGGVFSFKPSGFGKGLKRDNDSSTISSTISKDNTRGECARQAELLAEFGKKKQPMGFAKAFVHMSLKPHPPQPFQEDEDDMEAPGVIPLTSKM